MTRWIYLDTETTHLDRRKRRIWDLAYIIRDPDVGYDDVERQFFLMVDLRKADPMSLKIGGYYERHPDPFEIGDKLDELPHVWNVMRQVALDFKNAVIVGAVPSFDEETLAREFHRCNLATTWHYHLVDVETLAAGALGLPPPWDFDKVLAEFGLAQGDDRHTALGDARLVRDLYDKVLSIGNGKE